MSWSQSVPTTPGHYWWRPNCVARPQEHKVLFLRRVDRDHLVVVIGGAEINPRSLCGEWAQPSIKIPRDS